MNLENYQAQGADFIIELKPKSNSINDEHVSSISSSKISDWVYSLSSYLIKSDVPNCSEGQVLTKSEDAYSCISPVTSSHQKFAGEILTFSGQNCPPGTIFADGRLLMKTVYSDLFVAIVNCIV